LKHLNESLEEKVKQRTSEIEKQKIALQEINNEILDSIHYAKRIQDTLLPQKKYLEQNAGEHFIIFKPKDIVSGDFYWINKKEDNLFVAAVDCTGHGVPGALVSMVAHGGLQRSVHVFKEKEPAKMLDLLNATIEEGFNAQGDGNIKDGMDIALYSLNKDTLELTYAGANNPLYIIREGKQIILSPNKQPIGSFENRKPFTQEKIKVKKGDCIYAFSDGFADQFGGPNNKKYKYSRFKELLLSIHSKPMNEQLNDLEKEFDSWMGSNNQTDDVTVVGLRV
jgi:serine phosphatase RsbU (regulator of sigma subunit)